ncbi:MAG TPA: 3-oxoacyl-[acyl-carrier-protein] synthase III C-terminal domain-containing protein [Steroidobacteraceae bacterium]|nr:3-oxoacyl-[acyl-carrier-protein] synthase III C-terminal domain-containing protein [Steroidobacteraceae bacterium]
MSDVGIKSFAAYIPRLRLDRAAIAAAHAWALPGLRGLAKGERSFGSWDEDAITMAVEAGRACMATKLDGRVGSLIFASTSAPFADLQNASIVSGAVGLAADTGTLDTSGSLRAGTSALIHALKGNAADDVLVVAAENRLTKPGSAQEMQYGCGSCALRVGRGAVIAKLIGSASSISQFVDHFRANGQKYDYQWEERWIRDEGYLKIIPEAVSRLFEQTGLKSDAIDFLCVPGTVSGISAAIAKQLKIKPEAVVDNLSARCGDTGAVHPLMMLGLALEKASPGQKILVVALGAGCDVLLLEATDGIRDRRPTATVTATLARGCTDKNYLKLLSFSGELDLDWGMRSETDPKTALTQLYRAQDQVTAFVGGKCTSCGTIQFPRMPACVNCGSTEPMAPYHLADEPAKVATYTADWLMFYLSPPLYVGLVQFDNGARVLMEMVDVDPASFDVGSPLRMVFRIKEKDSMRHYNRYFWKAAPALSGATSAPKV